MAPTVQLAAARRSRCQGHMPRRDFQASWPAEGATKKELWVGTDCACASKAIVVTRQLLSGSCSLIASCYPAQATRIQPYSKLARFPVARAFELVRRIQMKAWSGPSTHRSR